MIRKTLVINGVTRNLVLAQDETLAKVLREHLLLISDPLYDERRVDKQDDKGRKRAQHQGHGKEQQQRGHIHRMADNAVQAGIDDLLILLHLHRPGQVGILPQHLGVQAIPQQEHRRRGPGSPGRKSGPPEAKIQPGDNEGAQKHHAAQSDHGPLFALLLPAVQPFFQQRRILQHHENPRSKHGHEQNAQQKPGLGPAQRTRADKQRDSDKQEPGKKLGHGLAEQSPIHSFPLSPCAAAAAGKVGFVPIIIA